MATWSSDSEIPRKAILNIGSMTFVSHPYAKAHSRSHLQKVPRYAKGVLPLSACGSSVMEEHASLCLKQAGSARE